MPPPATASSPRYRCLPWCRKFSRPVSEVCHRFDPLPQILKNVRYRSGKPLDHAEVKSAIVDGEMRLNGHGRLLVRSSGTEPVIRVMGEGDDRILVEEVVDQICRPRSATPRRHKPALFGRCGIADRRCGNASQPSAIVAGRDHGPAVEARNIAVSRIFFRECALEQARHRVRGNAGRAGRRAGRGRPAAKGASRRPSRGRPMSCWPESASRISSTTPCSR